MTVPARCTVAGCTRLALATDPAGRCWWCQPGQRDECDWHGPHAEQVAAP